MTPQDLSKDAKAATMALGNMLKTCHQLEPDSPACDALANAIKVVAEVEGQYGETGAAGAQATSVADAVGQLHSATQAGAAPAPPPGGIA